MLHWAYNINTRKLQKLGWIEELHVCHTQSRAKSAPKKTMSSRRQKIFYGINGENIHKVYWARRDIRQNYTQGWIYGSPVQPMCMGLFRHSSQSFPNFSSKISSIPEMVMNCSPVRKSWMYSRWNSFVDKYAQRLLLLSLKQSKSNFCRTQSYLSGSLRPCIASFHLGSLSSLCRCIWSKIAW